LNSGKLLGTGYCEWLCLENSRKENRQVSHVTSYIIGWHQCADFGIATPICWSNVRITLAIDDCVCVSWLIRKKRIAISSFLIG